LAVKGDIIARLTHYISAGVDVCDDSLYLLTFRASGVITVLFPKLLDSPFQRVVIFNPLGELEWGVSSLNCCGLALSLEFVEGFLLDLPDPFPRYAKALSNFLQCVV